MKYVDWMANFKWRLSQSLDCNQNNSALVGRKSRNGQLEAQCSLDAESCVGHVGHGNVSHFLLESGTMWYYDLHQFPLIRLVGSKHVVTCRKRHRQQAFQLRQQFSFVHLRFRNLFRRPTNPAAGAT